MKNIKCGKCGKEIEKSRSAVSNWMMKESIYICGGCQGYLSNYPDQIIGWGANGKPGLIVKIAE